MMFALLLIPFAIFGIVTLARRGSVSSSPELPPQLALSAPFPPGPMIIVRGELPPPSPIAVLCTYMQSGQAPPEMVIRCSIAEAQLLGRGELAAQIARQYGHLIAPAQPQISNFQGGGMPPQAPLQMPAPPQLALPSPQMAPQMAQASASSRFDETNDALEREAMQLAQVQPSVAQQAQQAQQVPAAIAAYQAGQSVQGSAEINYGPPPNMSSPLAGVADGQWLEFCGRIVRESPLYDSPTHVGRYRLNKQRLAQIGMDPGMLVGAADAQDQAFGADMQDAQRQLAVQEMTKLVGRPVRVPDVAEPIVLTLSGLLGLAAVAGLKGCHGWISNREDRVKFPNTTQAFLRTNGVF